MASGKSKRTQQPPLIVYNDEFNGNTGSSIPLLNQVPMEDDEPPAYSDVPSTSEPQFTPFSERRNDPPIPSRADDNYVISSQKTVEDRQGSKSIIFSNSLATNPKLLSAFIAHEARRKPNPIIRMEGTHTERRRRDKPDDTLRVIDFDITVSASDLLALPWRRLRIMENGMKTYRGTRTKSYAENIKLSIESAARRPTAEELYHRFCASSSVLKTFTISRQIINYDDKVLIDALNGVLRSTNYRGNINISFKVEDRATTIMSDHPLNHYRTNKVIWWTCIFLQLWIITWPVLWLMTRRWEMLYVDWPCRIYRRSDGSWPNMDEENPARIHEGVQSEAADAHATNNVRLAVMSEQEWVEGWRGAIVRAAEDRKQGRLYESDRRAATAVERRNAERRFESGQRAKDARRRGFVGATLGLISGAADTFRDFRMARGWGNND